MKCARSDVGLLRGLGLGLLGVAVSVSAQIPILYSFDASSPIAAGTWQGAYWSAQTALTALDAHQPGLCAPLLAYLRTHQAPKPPLRSILQALINTLASSTAHFLLVLDDYHVITEPEIHHSLTYLVEHLPPQLHLILVTRADPPLPLSLLRARGEMLEVRTNQLRCTPEEVRAFFQVVMGMQLSRDLIQEVTARTEGWCGIDN